MITPVARRPRLGQPGATARRDCPDRARDSHRDNGSLDSGVMSRFAGQSVLEAVCGAKAQHEPKERMTLCDSHGLRHVARPGPRIVEVCTASAEAAERRSTTEANGLNTCALMDWENLECKGHTGTPRHQWAIGTDHAGK